MSLVTPTAAFDTHTRVDAAGKVDLADLSSSDDNASLSAGSEDGLDALKTDEVVEPKQTRQARDWRPKSSLHLKIARGEKLSAVERLAARTMLPEEYYEMKDEDFDRGPLQQHSLLDDHVWILARALPPLVLHQLSFYFFPTFKWPASMAYAIYTLAYGSFMINVVGRCGKLALKYGTLDEKNIGRDRVPDASLMQLAKGFLAYIFLRPLGEFLLSWDASVAPLSSLRWSTPVRFFAYLMIMDYFFYVYHRSCHEVDFLWKIHSKHHQTKHPSPALAILADEWQELIEIVLVPLFSALLVPMTHAELHLMMAYVGYVEVIGHSGIRNAFHLPISGPILRLIGCELLIEDHDHHHRFGKSGRNYGKQTRFWDVLFGTTTDRNELANLPGFRPL